MDKVVQKLVALGVPGLVFLMAVAISGVTGGAAIVTALAFLGGPFGMLGGIAALAVGALVVDALGQWGLEALFKEVVEGLRKKGLSHNDIRSKVKSYPISKSLKREIFEHLDRLK
jgi:hypothetical protein